MGPDPPVSVDAEAAGLQEPRTPAAKISVEQVKDSLDEPKSLDRYRLQIGLGVVIGLLVLIVLVLLLVAVFAFATYPEADEIRSTVEKKSNLHKALSDDRDGWISNIKDLLQLLLVSLLVPTLTTVIGYIFGRQEGARSSGENA
jgi:hypothetical protein